MGSTNMGRHANFFSDNTETLNFKFSDTDELGQVHLAHLTRLDLTQMNGHNQEQEGNESLWDMVSAKGGRDNNQLSDVGSYKERNLRMRVFWFKNTFREIRGFFRFPGSLFHHFSDLFSQVVHYYTVDVVDEVTSSLPSLLLLLLLPWQLSLSFLQSSSFLLMQLLLPTLSSLLPPSLLWLSETLFFTKLISMRRDLAAPTVNEEEECLMTYSWLVTGEAERQLGLNFQRHLAPNVLIRLLSA